MLFQVMLSIGSFVEKKVQHTEISKKSILVLKDLGVGLKLKNLL